MSTVKFKFEKQKKVKGLSKAISIIAKIGKALTIIGIIGIVICMSLAPVIVNNIKIGDKTVEVFGEKFDREENKLVSQSHNNVVIEDKDLDIVIDYLQSKKSLTNIGYIEAALVTVIITMGLSYFALRYLDKLFTNINKEDSPFTLENVSYIKKIAYLMIGILILPNFTSFFTGLIVEEDVNMGVDLTEVLYILIIFAMSYIFEYGYELQSNSKRTMYGEIDE